MNRSGRLRCKTVVSQVHVPWLPRIRHVLHTCTINDIEDVRHRLSRRSSIERVTSSPLERYTRLMQLNGFSMNTILTHEIAVAWKQRLPTEVEDVAPWIPRVSSKDSRIRHVWNILLQGRRHRVVVHRRSHPQATGPNRDYIKSPILRPARCVHQHGLQAEFVLRCRGGGEREGIGQRWGSGG